MNVSVSVSTACKFWENQQMCAQNAQWHPPFVAPAAVAQDNGMLVIAGLSVLLAVVCVAYLVWTLRSIKRRELEKM